MNYPDIDFLHRKAENLVLLNHDSHKRYVPDLELHMFPQMWPNTGGGMAKEGCVYGQAFTRQYTSVFVNTQDQVAVVCFDNRMAYFVPHFNEIFKYDLNRHALRSLGKALQMYKAVEIPHE